METRQKWIIVIALVLVTFGFNYAIWTSYNTKIDNFEFNALLRQEYITTLEVLITDLKAHVVTLETTIEEYASVVRFITQEKTVLEAKYEERTKLIVNLRNQIMSLEAQKIFFENHFVDLMLEIQRLEALFEGGQGLAVEVGCRYCAESFSDWPSYFGHLNSVHPEWVEDNR